ncbi:uncharacterized protein M6B38_170360 [Iris pallida]|uniref:DUF599 domain-containing protein n=1 Tax=Iris pallida TaxID=29817 RepID=A0AAX6EU85_IRIPA|nr:uncharacterized protein M6B38_170360 [Iris pallida]
MEKRTLDYVLVPSGVAIMVAYHLWLLYRILRHPTKTVVGINTINRRIWVQTMMEDTTKNGILAVQTLRNNIMASTLMATTAIMLSSVIAVLMTNSSLRGQNYALGDNTDLCLSIKMFSVLVCFLLAFLLYVQSIRYYSHANILINVPAAKTGLGTGYVSRAMNRGSYFWSMGLRAYYFSFPLIMWVFGAVPMVCCSLLMVLLLYFLDVYSGWGADGREVTGEEWAEAMC